MTVDDGATGAWDKVHDAYLETHLDRLRLLARQRARWLRTVRWGSDPLDANGADADARVDRQLTPRSAPPHESLHPDEEAARLAQEVADHDQRLSEYEDELAALGSPPGLTVLRQAMGLSAVEREAVIVALAPELDHTFRSLYAYLHDDPALRAATPGLVADLTGRPLAQVWDLLHPDAPSRRWRVFAAADGPAGSAHPLRLDARVVAFLRGRNQLDERLHDVVEPLPDLPLAAAQRALADRVAGWVSDPERVAGHRVVNLLGAPGQGREAVAAAVARALGLVPLRLHTGRLAQHGDVERARLLDRETLLLPAAVYADAPDEAVQDPAALATASQVLDDLGGLLLVGSRTRHPGRQPAVTLDVPTLSAADRVGLWRAALGDRSARTEHLTDLVEEFTLGPEGILRAADEARARAELHTGRGGAVPGRDELWAACRATAGGELGELATRLEPASAWDELVLPDRDQQLLRDIAAQVAARPRVYGQWGFARRLARGRGITALFAGPSGTGKTMAAEVVAGHLDLDLYRIDLSAVVSKYIGETEKNLRRVFDAAEAGGAILFFDEADALFGKRTEVSDSHDRHANVEINYLLQRMEDYAGLAILATNRKADLDPAFLRRIRFVVTFPFPDLEHRRRIWQKVWPAETPLDGLDLDALARLEIAGGNVRTIAVNAAFLAADAGEPVGMTHVMRAARHEYDKLDRRPSRTEFGDHHEAVQP